MYCRLVLGFLLLCVLGGLSFRKTSSYASDPHLTVAFYNLDNLFDDLDDTTHNDRDFTPSGTYKWGGQKYARKLDNMERVISKMVGGKAPDILGVCELESRKALNDLFSTGSLKGHYDIVHYDSPDERGIDVGLAYNTSKIQILDSRPAVVKLSRDPQDKTRDLLWVKALLKETNDTLQLIVCHFPSRREGKEESEQDRIDAALACKKLISETCDPARQNLIVLGDFNDEPWDKSISQHLGASDINNAKGARLLNLMWHLKTAKKGSYFYKGRWEVLDQIIVSKSLADKKGMDIVPGSVKVMKEKWMIQQLGKYKGYPLRTFGGDVWLDGYSDHLPVYMTLKL